MFGNVRGTVDCGVGRALHDRSWTDDESVNSERHSLVDMTDVSKIKKRDSRISAVEDIA